LVAVELVVVVVLPETTVAAAAVEVAFCRQPPIWTQVHTRLPLVLVELGQPGSPTTAEERAGSVPSLRVLAVVLVVPTLRVHMVDAVVEVVVTAARLLVFLARATTVLAR